jgi:two-component system, OmpR family, sensor kinase
MTGKHRLLLVWIALATGAASLMWLVPGQETIPYHLAWIALALAYDREVWSLRPTVIALLVFTTITGGVLFTRAAEGAIGWQETAEVPLMAGLLLIVMWNIRRRQQALASLAELAARDRRRAALRERLSRLTSHEMRTPATIALGYADLLLSRETDEESRGDLEIVKSELERLVLVSDRLVRMIRMPDLNRRERVVLRELVTDTVDRWHVVADRRWVVDADHSELVCSVDRVRACLDTLIENALRYTGARDTVRVISRSVGDQLIIGVADSGTGLDDQTARLINDPLGHGTAKTVGLLSSGSPMDPKAQTGLGLRLVAETAAVRGGKLVAGRSAERGALVLMLIPYRLAEPEASAASSPAPKAGDASFVGRGRRVG